MSETQKLSDRLREECDAGAYRYEDPSDALRADLTAGKYASFVEMGMARDVDNAVYYLRQCGV